MKLFILFICTSLIIASHFMFPFVIGEPLTYGWLIADHGWVPHRDYVDQHTQGLPLLIALLTKLTGDALLAARLIFIATPILTVVLLTRISLLAPLTFTLWYIMWAKNTAWFHDPIVFLAPLAILSAIRRRIILSGLALGAALLFKQTAIVFYPVILLSFWQATRDQNRFRSVARKTAIFSIAILIPILLYLFYFWTNNALPEMWEQAFIQARTLQAYNQEYFGLYIAPPKASTLAQLSILLILIPISFRVILASDESCHSGKQRATRIAPDRLRTSRKKGVSFGKDKNSGMTPTILFLATLAALAFSYPQLTLQHASLATPFLAILTTWLLTQRGSGAIPREERRAMSGASFWRILVFPGMPPASRQTLLQRRALGRRALGASLILVLTITPQLPRAVQSLQHGDPQTATKKDVITAIQTYTSPEETITICCGEPRYYYDTQRIPATKFLFFSELAAALDWDRQMTEELRTNRPQHVLYSPTYFDIAQHDPAIYGEEYAAKKKTASAFIPMFEQELLRSYRPIATISPTIQIFRPIVFTTSEVEYP